MLTDPGLLEVTVLTMAVLRCCGVTAVVVWLVWLVVCVWGVDMCVGVGVGGRVVVREGVQRGVGLLTDPGLLGGQNWCSSSHAAAAVHDCALGTGILQA